MTLNEYQEEAAKTAIYPEAGTGTLKAVSYCSIALAGEVGEALNKIKKILRGDGNGAELRFQACDELGGALWYISQLATELGFTLHEMGCRNIALLQDRQARGVLKGSGDNR